MKLKAIIFDVDGVLLNSDEIIIELFQKVARDFKLRVPTDKEIKELSGKPLNENIEFFWPDFDVDLFAKTYREQFINKVILPFDGSVETLSRLRKSGFKFGIVSGKLRFFIDKHMREAGYNMKWFDVIVSCEDTKNHKPSPDPILFACKKLKLKPEEVIFVGDSRFDYEAAKATKVNFVAVLTGVSTEKELKKMGVKNIINSVFDLPKFLKV
jgi:HAD superfamily hydrolase (TIGR01509 family)